MIKFTVGENQGNQRLDRFLKKYFAKASLSHIYKLIRKDIKLNGKRAKPETILSVGDQLTVYMSEEEASALQRQKEIPRTKKQFTVLYEDENKTFRIIDPWRRERKKESSCQPGA